MFSEATLGSPRYWLLNRRSREKHKYNYKTTWYIGWVRMEPGERTTVDFGDSATATEASGILEVGTKFKSWTQTKEAIDAFQ